MTERPLTVAQVKRMFAAIDEARANREWREAQQPCGHPMSQYDPTHRECKACCALARMGDA